MERNFLTYILLCILFFTSSSCRDDLPLYGGGEVGEGESVISATVKFKSFTPALNGSTRTAGDAIKAINSLCVLLYDEDGNLVRKYPLKPGDASGEGTYILSDKSRENNEKTDSNGNTLPSAETKTPHADFQLTVPYGRYYIYAVANMGDLSNNQDSIKTVRGLRNIPLRWNEGNIGANNQMIGHFVSLSDTGRDGDGTESGSTGVGGDASLLTINRANMKLRAWLRRAASKVTIAYDGSQLKNNVSIYIMAASIKDIPKSCPLGEMNTPNRTDSLIHDGEIIKYFEGEELPNDFQNNHTVIITNESKKPYGDHSETADALFFYENMQGEGKDKNQTASGPGNDNGSKPGIGYPDPDESVEGSGWKDNKRYGTYIEVDAIYRSEYPGHTGVGTIKYRFMLGKNTTTDYNAERNHHYKLTLKFRNFADDYDWHIDYNEAVFEVTEPETFNYQGKIFVPEYRPETKNYNYGHKFVDENTVTVSSFIGDDFTAVPWEITYDEDGDGNYTEECSWLEASVDGYLPYMKEVSFKVNPESIKPMEIDIDKELQNAKQKGTEEAPYNLANPGQMVAPASATIKCTANCYIVDAPGYYIFPLVYGNAIHNFAKNENSYKYSGKYTGDQILDKFKDYKGNAITGPYIKDTTKPEYTPQSAFLVWQDEPNLINYEFYKPGTVIKYLPDAYGGVGGIQFYIDKANIKQGNAVIGVGAENVDYSNGALPPVMWSWHIWVTNFNNLSKDDKNMEVIGHDSSQKFTFFPVNLGWCSDHGDIIKYYKGRKCKVKFKTSVGTEKFIEIEQKSHIAFTRGNNTYYQWGRKDPFVGATGVKTVPNKRRYYSLNWYDDRNPLMLSDTLKVSDSDRYTTRKAIDEGVLIQNPHLWHNPRRKENPDHKEENDGEYPYLSDNEIYRNLWQGRLEVQANSPSLKTVYDPCPVGYQVPYFDAFTGFTTTGDNTNTPFEWYDVRVENIAEYNEATGQCGENGIYSKGLYEFYINPSKLQSIIFPETGYRDWDANAHMFQNYWDEEGGAIGYIWTAGNDNGNDNSSYNFEFSRKDRFGLSYIRPKNTFYPCDGFPIRPCLYDSHDSTVAP